MKEINVPAHILAHKYKKGEILPSEVIEIIFKRIKEKDKEINSFISIFEEESFEKAKKLDEKIKNKETTGLLFGIPIAIKDNICVKGKPLTCASKILEGYIATYNATAVEKILNENAIILGKTNMDEFAMGSSNEYSYFGPVQNPLKKGYVPGGSSGGSAASVAAGFCIAALGSDTGGSVRQPASFTGLVGFKPTYGRVSRFGLVAFASSCDQIGPITKDVMDAWIIFKIIAGYDEKDKTTLNYPIEEIPEEEIKFKIGYPENLLKDGVDEEIRNRIDETVREFARIKNYNLKEINMETFKIAIPVYHIITGAEASSNLARFDGIRYGLREKGEDLEDIYKKTRGKGFGEEVIRRILMGAFVLRSGYYEEYYLKAQKARTLILEEFIKNFGEVDFIITPTSPFPPFKIGEKIEDPIKLYLADIFTVSANLAGIPAISIPCGKNKEGLPIGIQIMARPLDEARLFKFSLEIEKFIKEKYGD
ncbi:MAG: Asp-tRNA(Asn)/Glu-tRNA(Gln) amidotransferase subunit GatA [candidate division WOR-3 bacterium]